MATQTEMQTGPAKPSTSKSETADSTDLLLSELEGTNTLPLWVQMQKLNPPLPNPTTVPHIWRYDQLRPYLLRAGELISEKHAERRVLMLVNPARGMYIGEKPKDLGPC